MPYCYLNRKTFGMNFNDTPLFHSSFLLFIGFFLIPFLKQLIAEEGKYECRNYRDSKYE